MPRLSDRVNGMGSDGISGMYDRIRGLEAAGRSLVHLEIGEPEFATPPELVEAAIHALRRGDTHYVGPAGVPALRTAVAQDVERVHGIRVDASEIVVGPGAKALLFYSMLAALQDGDECLIPDPGYPFYETTARMVGAIPVRYRLDPSRGFAIDMNDLTSKITPHTKLIIVNSPHNPTGALIDFADADELAARCHQLDCWVLSDEVYSEIVFDGEHVSVWSRPGMRDRTILLQSFSKTFSMSGWRLGYVIAPGILAAAIVRLVRNSVTCTAPFVQYAGAAALAKRPLEVARQLRELRARRDAFVPALQHIDGVHCTMPRGGYYAMLDVSELGLTAEMASDSLLTDAGVAVVPGTAFGPTGSGHVRVFAMPPLEQAQRAIERIERWAQTRVGLSRTW